MTSNRFRRIVRARWWVLATIALVTIVIATVFVNAKNDSISEREATAGITFQRLVGEFDDTELQQRLDDAAQIAIEVNSSQISTGVDPLLPGASAEIIPDTLSGRLLFFGRGDTDAAARGLARELRDRFLQAQTLDNSAEIDRRIAQATVQLDAVVALIAAATEEPPIDEEEIARRIKIRELQAEVDALTARYGALTVELITPTDPPRDAAVIEAERTAIRRQLNAAEQELLTVQAAEVVAPPEDSKIAVLRSEETQLRLLLDGLVAQRIADEPIGTLDPIVTQSTGIELLRPLPIQALALFLGLFIGLTGLVLLDRSRQPVWTATDLQPQYRLPEIARRPHSSVDHTSQSWYPIASQGKRKAGIQRLRSHVEGLPNFGSGITVGIASLSNGSRDVHELAADLAASLSGSGTRTLLIDADFGDPTDLSEFRRSGCDLKMALENPTGCLSQADPDTDETSVSGISISHKIVDSPDILAKPEFTDLLTAAKYEYGVVIVACPPSSTAGYHVLTQRLDAMILVSEIGNPLPSDLDIELQVLEDRRAHPLGVVLLTAAENPLQAVIKRIPGGFSLRRVTGQQSEIHNVEDGTQQQPGEETPAPVTTTEAGSDAEQRKPASSAGFRVDIVSGSNPARSNTSDDGGPPLSLDDSPTQAGSTTSEGDAAASTQATFFDGQAPRAATVQETSAESRKTESSSGDPSPIDVDGAPSEKKHSREDAPPTTPTAEDDRSATTANRTAVRNKSTRTTRTRKTTPRKVTKTDAPGASSSMPVGESASGPTRDDKTPDGPRSDYGSIEPRESAPQPSMAADVTITTEASDKRQVAPTSPDRDGEKANQITTVASGTSSRKPTTNNTSTTRRRNAKGQFLPAEPSKKKSVYETTPRARQTPTTTTNGTAGTGTPEAPPDTAPTSDDPADATN